MVWIPLRRSPPPCSCPTCGGCRAWSSATWRMVGANRTSQSASDRARGSTLPRGGMRRGVVPGSRRAGACVTPSELLPVVYGQINVYGGGWRRFVGLVIDSITTDHAARPSAPRRAMMLMPNSVLILLSRCSLLYSAIRGLSSRSGSPRKHHHLEKRMDGMDDDDWLFRAERGGNLCTNTWRTRSESCAPSG